ncbi:MAG: aminotransferase class V-fold PLP-dependent enzyme, partial [Clostridia bacterium]|nr:aminotransferase class V-fold PLP-dependent enzyme [Clostridia bacterium]
MRQEKPTLYWDNAATTWPKPVSVHRAIMDAMNKCGGNPGRAGHRMSMEAAEHIFACRQEIAEFFGLADPTGVVFTLNCTMALNMVIQGVVRQGGRVLISDLEHNAVWRTACALEPFGSRVDIARWSPNAEETVENFRRQIRPDTRLLVCTHASNVFGVTFPVRELAQLAHRYGVPLCVDAAQSAGVLPINMETDEIDYLCVAAHKGLYAPMGTGVLLCREMQKVPAFVRGGTGSQSENPRQPEE